MQTLINMQNPRFNTFDLDAINPVISKNMHRTETRGFLAHVSMGFGKVLYDYANNFSELAVKYFSQESLSLNQHEGSFKKKMKMFSTAMALLLRESDPQQREGFPFRTILQGTC